MPICTRCSFERDRPFRTDFQSVRRPHNQNSWAHGGRIENPSYMAVHRSVDSAFLDRRCRVQSGAILRFPGGKPMLTMLGSPRRCCDGITRRETLKAGALGMLGGFALPQLLEAEE